MGGGGLTIEGKERDAEKQKGPTLVGPVWRLPASGPIPTIPGGWGLRNPEPKGPGQRSISLSLDRTAHAGRKWGGIMIPLTIP